MLRLLRLLLEGQGLGQWQLGLYYVLGSLLSRHCLLNGGLHLWPELRLLLNKLLYLGCLLLLELRLWLWLLYAGLSPLLKELWLVLKRHCLLLKGLQLLCRGLLELRLG